jgi:cytochrome c oxidase subunit 2
MSHRPLILSCVGLLLLGACKGAQTPLVPSADQASGLFGLLQLMLGICGLMYLLVLGFLALAIWRARRKLQPAPNASDAGLTLSLGVWAGIIVVGLSILTVGSFMVDRSLGQASAHEQLVVRVTGQQWWWRIAYRLPGSTNWVETANELHLPVGQTARIELGSVDVIHSFWVPNVAGKTDVIPGRANALDITPRRQGWFRGQCAEFCGLQHAHMALDVKVERPQAFQAWLQTQANPAQTPTDPILVRGMQVLTAGPCGACHVVRGTPANGRPGPDLTHLASRRSIAAGLMPFSRAAVQGWIAQPAALKPGTNMPAVSLSPSDADAVARYLAGLK